MGLSRSLISAERETGEDVNRNTKVAKVLPHKRRGELGVCVLPEIPGKTHGSAAVTYGQRYKKKLLKSEISCGTETISSSPSGRLGLPVCPLYLTCDVWCDCASVRRFSGEHLRTLSALGSFKDAALMFGREGLTCTSVVSAFTSIQARRKNLINV